MCVCVCVGGGGGGGGGVCDLVIAMCRKLFLLVVVLHERPGEGNWFYSVATQWPEEGHYRIMWSQYCT